LFLGFQQRRRKRLGESYLRQTVGAIDDWLVNLLVT
jgi:hypothetical protein